MTKYLTFLLYVGLAWGQHLKIANAKGDTIVIKQGERFILNGLQHKLKKVDYQKQSIFVKGRLMPWVFAPYSFINFLYPNREVGFNSVRTVKHMKRPYRILPTFIGSMLGFYVYYIEPPSDLDWFNAWIARSIAGSGFTVSITEPTFSKKISLDDNEWSIVND